MPISGEGASPFSDGTWIGVPQALNEGMRPADLAALRGKPGFEDLTDAQIGEKIRDIRQETLEAIELISRFDYKLGTNVQHVFFNRRLTIEFSDRPVAGALDGSSLGKKHEDAGNAGIAVKVYPGGRVPDFDFDFIKLVATLIHEGTHLSQEWTNHPKTMSRIEFQEWRDEMNKRVVRQDNEIAASRAERAFLRGLWEAMKGIRLTGAVPTDDPSVSRVIPPLARAIAQKFLDATPPGERVAKATDLENKLLPAFGLIDELIAFRLVVRNKAAEMRDRPEPQDFGAVNLLAQEWLVFIRATSWYQRLGPALDDGIFSLSLAAGGSGTDANRVRQYDANGNLIPLTITGLTNITDVVFYNDRSILIGGLSTVFGQGAIYSLTDTNLDNLFDLPSLTLVKRDSGLDGGVSLACDRTAGRSFCLGRRTGNLYQLTAAWPALPTDTGFLTSITQTPVHEENYNLLLPPGGTELFFVPEFGGCITEGTRWSSAPATGPVLNNIRTFSPFTICKLKPVFLDNPFISDKYVRCGGRPFTELRLYNTAVNPAVLLGTATTDGGGAGLFYIPPITTGMKLRVSDTQGDDSVIFQPGSAVATPGQNTLPPQVFAVPGLGGPAVVPPVFRAPPHTDYRVEFSEKAGWTSFIPATGTTAGDGFIKPAAGPGALTVNPSSGFWRIKWTGRSDIVPDRRILTTTPGIPASINLREGEFDFGTADGRSNATYTIVNSGGLHEDICHISTDGKSLECTGLLTRSDTTTNPVVVRIRRTDAVNGDVQDFFIENYSNRRALVEPQFFAGGNTVAVPCLVINGSPCPIYQFLLSNNAADTCTEPHWHTNVGTTVWNLTGATPAMENTADSCGWGLADAVPFVFANVSLTAWQDFTNAHPPPVEMFK